VWRRNIAALISHISVAEVINKKENNIWRRRTGIASTAAQENGD
jgi:hypothetical protein